MTGLILWLQNPATTAEPENPPPAPIALPLARLPMTPEAMLLHLIDVMDTRMHMVMRELREDRNNPSAWTPYNHNLGRRIYKGGASGDLYGEGGGGYD